MPSLRREKKLTVTLKIPKSALYRQVLPTPAALKALTWEKDGTTHHLSAEQVKRVENEWVAYTPGGLVVAPEGDSRPAVARDFSAMFAKVAKAESAALIPFLLKGVADIDNAESMFQPDRIHPKDTAHPVMLDNVWPVLRTQLPR